MHLFVEITFKAFLVNWSNKAVFQVHRNNTCFDGEKMKIGRVG
jgi:hypothetical protein